MGAATEMSRLDSIPTKKLHELLGMEGVPTVTGDDNGKVLTVNNGEWKAVTPAKELPAVSGGDNGKVLTVDSGKWKAVTPATPTPELPAVSGDDNGKVLMVVDGQWAVGSLTPAETPAAEE